MATIRDESYVQLREGSWKARAEAARVVRRDHCLPAVPVLQEVLRTEKIKPPTTKGDTFKLMLAAAKEPATVTGGTVAAFLALLIVALILQWVLSVVGTFYFLQRAVCIAFLAVSLVELAHLPQYLMTRALDPKQGIVIAMLVLIGAALVMYLMGFSARTLNAALFGAVILSQICLLVLRGLAAYDQQVCMGGATRHFYLRLIYEDLDFRKLYAHYVNDLYRGLFAYHALAATAEMMSVADKPACDECRAQLNAEETPGIEVRFLRCRACSRLFVGQDVIESARDVAAVLDANWRAPGELREGTYRMNWLLWIQENGPRLPQSRRPASREVPGQDFDAAFGSPNAKPAVAPKPASASQDTSLEALMKEFGEAVDKATEVSAQKLAENYAFDFDRVDIIKAADEDVEQFVTVVASDVEETRRSTHSTVRCTVSSACGLSPAVMEMLSRTFGEVQVMPDSSEANP